MAITVTESNKPLSRDWNTIATDINTKILHNRGDAGQRIEFAIQQLAGGPRPTDGQTGVDKGIWTDGSIPSYFTDLFTGTDVGMQREIAQALPPSGYNRALQKNQREVYPELAKRLYRKLFKTVKVKDEEGNETEETEEVPDRGYYFKGLSDPPTEEEIEFRNRIEGLPWGTPFRFYLNNTNDDGTAFVDPLIDAAPELFDIIVNNYPDRVLDKDTYSIQKIFPDLQRFLAQPYILNPHDYHTLVPGQGITNENITGMHNLHNELNPDTGMMEPAESKFKVGIPPDPDDPQAEDLRIEFTLQPDRYMFWPHSLLRENGFTIECTSGSIEVDTDKTGRARPQNQDVFLALMIFNGSSSFRGPAPFDNYFTEYMFIGRFDSGDDFSPLDLNELRDVAVDWMQSRMLWVTDVTSKTNNSLTIPLYDHHGWKVGNQYAMAVFASEGGGILGDRCISRRGAPIGGPSTPTGYRQRNVLIGNANQAATGPFLASCPLFPPRYRCEVTSITPHVIDENSQEITTRGSVTIEFDRDFSVIRGARGDNEIIQQMIDSKPLPITEGDFRYEHDPNFKLTGTIVYQVRLSFLKLLPIVYEDGNDVFNREDDFALSVNYSDAQFYLRAMSTGFCRPEEPNPDSGAIPVNRQLTFDGTNFVGTNANGDPDNSIARMCNSPRSATLIKDYTIERYYEDLGTHEPVVSLNRKDNQTLPNTTPGTLTARQAADMSNALRRYKGFVPNTWFYFVTTTRAYKLLRDEEVDIPGFPFPTRQLAGIDTGIPKVDPETLEPNDRPEITPWDELPFREDTQFIGGVVRNGFINHRIDPASSPLTVPGGMASYSTGFVQRTLVTERFPFPQEYDYFAEFASYVEFEISLNIGYPKVPFEDYVPVPHPYTGVPIGQNRNPDAYVWLAQGLPFDYCIRDFTFSPDIRDPEQKAYSDERKHHEGGPLVLGEKDWFDMIKAQSASGPTPDIDGNVSWECIWDVVIPQQTDQGSLGTQYIIDIEPRLQRVIAPRPGPPDEEEENGP